MGCCFALSFEILAIDSTKSKKMFVLFLPNYVMEFFIIAKINIFEVLSIIYIIA